MEGYFEGGTTVEGTGSAKRWVATTSLQACGTSVASDGRLLRRRNHSRGQIVCQTVSPFWSRGVGTSSSAAVGTAASCLCFGRLLLELWNGCFLLLLWTSSSGLK